MKIRLGFVSNSSSSSFICNVCGEEYSEYEGCLEDAEMFECVNEHTICNDHAILVEGRDFHETKEEDEDGVGIMNMPKEFCPVCMMKNIIDSDILLYCLKRLYEDRDSISEKIKQRFKTFEEFKEYIG